MKRAFPQKVKPVSCNPSAVEATVGQSKQNPTGVHRKARTSAAMIGLALSMGASSLLLPRQDDGAAAAEPIAAESTLAVTPLAQQIATLPGADVDSLPTPSGVAIDHVVQEGQTIWQLAQRYRVNVQSIAAANSMTSDSTLQVGQVLVIPTASQISSASPASPLTTSPEAEGKVERDQALSRLRQERDKLRDSLTELRRDESRSLAAHPPKEGQPSADSSDRQSILSHRPVAEVGAQDQVQTENISSSSESDFPSAITHQVKPGETLGAIALAYSVPQQTLVAANQLPEPDWLRVNQSLVIPSVASGTQSEGTAAPTTQFSVDAISTPAQGSASVATTNSDSVVYRVSPGDTLGEIASIYGVPRQSLAQANHLQNPHLIVSGQVLQIPAPNEAIAQAIPVADESLVVIATPEGVNPLTVEATEPTIVDEPTVVAESTVLIEGAIAPSSDESAEVVEKADLESEELTQSVAVAPLSIAPETVEGSGTVRQGAFVENLLAEITSLRDRYRFEHSNPDPESQQNTASAPVVVAATSESIPLPSSELAIAAPSDDSSSTQTSSQAMAQNSEVRPVVATTPAQSGANAESPAVTRPRLVAAAPLGSENYAPLVQPIAGQSVSPDLPPLPDAEAYLPNLSPRFDGFIWPARGTLTSGYGWRWGRMHRGIDIGAPVGTPVYAVAEGTVQFSGWNSGGYGNMVEIRHDDGTVTRYAHHSRNLVRAGQRVEQGQHIAAVGSTGYSTGPHLHFEVHLPSQGTVNPIAYLPR